jgi:phosphohistidine phosphatase
VEIYLLRHGQAVSEWQDPLQPLSVSGRQDIERLAHWQQANNMIKVHTIFHSAKLRAKQTAEIVQSIAQPQAIILEKSGLMPNDSVENMRLFLEEEWPHLHPNKPALLLVGHLPYLDRLVSLLLFDRPDKTCLDIQPGTFICLTSDYGLWMIKWVISPVMLLKK